MAWPPPSRVKTLVFTSTQNLIRQRHESHTTIMEQHSPTRESWNRKWATDGAICDDSHVRVVIYGDKKWRLLFFTLTNATPLAIWKTICHGLLYISNNQKKTNRLLGKCRATFGEPSEPLTSGQTQTFSHLTNAILRVVRIETSTTRRSLQSLFRRSSAPHQAYMW